MATELEKALKKAKYTALPLPRALAGPTMVYSFQDGQLYVVRNAGSCLSLKPQTDPSVDTVQFTREYTLALSGVAGFVARIFGAGNAKAELEFHAVKSATVQMGGLAHVTIETGALLDALVQMPASPCLRDLTDPDHLVIVAALRAQTFSFTFSSKTGTTVKLGAKEATGLFQADAGVKVSVESSGKIVVNAPSIVGVVSWDGKTVRRELEAAKKYLGKPALAARRPAPNLLGSAAAPDEIAARRLKSLGVAPAAPRPRRAAPKRRPGRG